MPMFNTVWNLRAGVSRSSFRLEKLLIPLMYPWEEVTFKKKKDKALDEWTFDDDDEVAQSESEEVFLVVSLAFVFRCL